MWLRLSDDMRRTFMCAGATGSTGRNNFSTCQRKGPCDSCRRCLTASWCSVNISSSRYRRRGRTPSSITYCTPRLCITSSRSVQFTCNRDATIYHFGDDFVEISILKCSNSGHSRQRNRWLIESVLLCLTPSLSVFLAYNRIDTTGTYTLGRKCVSLMILHD